MWCSSTVENVVHAKALCLHEDTENTTMCGQRSGVLNIHIGQPCHLPLDILTHCHEYLQTLSIHISGISNVPSYLLASLDRLSWIRHISLFYLMNR